MINSQFLAGNTATIVRVSVIVLLSLVFWQIPVNESNASVYNTRDTAFLSVIDTTMHTAYTSDDFMCMAKNIYYEARGESYLGKLAVAQVTINRMHHPMFPKKTCSVVYQPGQFSWVRNTYRINTPYGDSWLESMCVAKQALSGRRINGMESALYFHSIGAKPNWRNVKPIAKIGNHVFYARK